MDELSVDVDRARRDAKRLVAAARRGDTAALERMRPDRAPRLADAQHAVAQSLGFRSWAGLLRAHEDAGAALRRAARAGDEDQLYRLLDAGAPPNARDRRTGRTALLEAAAADQLDSVSALVGWVPVDRRALDRRGRSALDLADPGSPVAAVLLSVGFGPDRGVLPDRYADLVDAAEVALLDHLSQARGVERYALGDGFMVRTGLADNSRNAVVCAELPADGTVDAIVDTIIGRFAGVPATWYVDGDTVPVDLRARLERAGCRPERDAVHMAAALHDLAGGPSTDIATVANVTGITRVADVAEVTAAGDLVHLDPDEAALLVAAGPPLRHFVIGRSAGLTTFVTGTTLLGVHLGVGREHRRGGLARVLIRHAVAAGRRDGCTHAVLAPAAATVPFYERLGFTLERSRPDRWFYLP